MNGGIRILIVDDEPDMLRGLRRILRLKGYEIETAASGEEAVQRAREFDPHGILMDIRMPGLNGVEAYREIRKDCPDAFVCFMTAYSELVAEAKEESRGEVFAKPLDVDEMCEAIAREATTRPVLIVDDDPDFCSSLQRVLAERGFQIDLAHSAEQAKDIFARRPRAVLLLDMKLNGETGFEVLLELQSLKPDITVIAMSGVPEWQQRMQEELHDRAVACFTKPLNLDEVISALHQIAKLDGVEE